MLREESLAEKSGSRHDGRIGDVAAMLRVMRPLNGGASDLIAGRRRLLADLCRFIGVQVGGIAPDVTEVSQPLEATSIPPIAELSPRQEQTLRHLLNGDSEKQVAGKLRLSPHTVHVYVKALYRRYGVSSRAELLAKHFQR